MDTATADVLVCAVLGCKVDGTKPLECYGSVACHVCPDHHQQITFDMKKGTARWVLAQESDRTRVLTIVRQSA